MRSRITIIIALIIAIALPVIILAPETTVSSTAAAKSLAAPTPAVTTAGLGDDFYTTVASGVVAVHDARKAIRGAGFITPDQLIVTAAHVVREGTRNQPSVSFFGGRKVQSAQIMAVDEQYDLAVLTVTIPEGARSLEWGAEPRIGDTSFILGHPWATPWTLTRGIVGRTGKVPVPEQDDWEGVGPVTIVDAIARPGTSGGPLLNEQGQVIGMVTQTLQDEGPGLVMAIPVTDLRTRYQTLLEGRAGTGPAQPGLPTPAVSQLGPLFPESVRRWEDLIVKYATYWDYDANFLAALMLVESCGDPQAQSPAGAMGLYQVMPFNFRPNEDPWDPDINMMSAVRYLNRARSSGAKDYTLLAAAYNGGIGVIRSGWWPAETQRFVRWVMGIYGEAHLPPEQAPTLQEWLKAGGDWLCRIAATR